MMTRRKFIEKTATASLAAAFLPDAHAQESSRKRLMTTDLVCGAIGVSANQREAIELAAKHGFESVGADAGYLAALSDSEVQDLVGLLQSNKLRFGAAGLTVEFRQDDAKFQQGMAQLPKTAAGLRRAGVTRVATWLTPCSDKTPFVRNFRQHATRLRPIAVVLKDHGIRLGLEYVGPKTSWASRRYPFIHTMAEMQDLIEEINTGNIGFLLDSWHWWNAGDSEKDLLSLKASDVVAVDLNDAPAGIPKDQQIDGKRELPCATGVIDVRTFLGALQTIGYDGPVRAEPFNQAVNRMGKDDACAAAAASIKKAFALLNS